MDAVFLIAIAAIVAISIGLMFGRYVFPNQPKIDPKEVAAAQIELAALKTERENRRVELEERSAELKNVIARIGEAREQNASLTERISGLSRQLQDQTNLARTLEQQRNNAESHAGDLGADVARLKERESHLIAKTAEQDKRFAELQKQLLTEFENVANRILKSTSIELSNSSQNKLAAILDPLRTRIQEFQQKVEKSFEAEMRDVLSLKEQIKLVVETSHAIGNQADGLARALRGDSQLLGRWGELALERILETAGLCEGREYISQGRGLGLKDDGGKAQRPDILVRLPENRTIVIDSKVPLSSYESLITSDDEQRAQRRDDFLADFKGHIEELAAKRYQDNEKLQAHDCVLMFVPIEGALAAALAAEPELFTYGWDRRVVLVGPPTLLMTMRTVASIWRYEQQSENAQDIARFAGDLCDKVTHSVEDFRVVADKMGDALEWQNEAIKRLTTGKGNALWIGQRIQELGVKTKRQIPSIIDGLPIAAGNGDADAQYRPPMQVTE